jgi:hypothetical protein
MHHHADFISLVIIVQMLKACNGDRRYGRSYPPRNTFQNPCMIRRTYNIAISFWLFCGVLLFLLVFTVIEDENKVQANILESIQGKRYQADFSNSGTATQSSTTLSTPPATSMTINPLSRNAHFLALDMDSQSETSSADMLSLGTPLTNPALSPGASASTSGSMWKECLSEYSNDSPANHRHEGIYLT